jgi:GNAT superfamily N-acetyltransferase
LQFQKRGTNMITSIWSQPGQPNPAAEAIYEEVVAGELGLPADAGPMALHLVLELDGQPVAAGALAYVSAGVGRLPLLCVRNRWRKQGIGDGLVKILIYKAETLGLTTVLLDTPAAHRDFFRSLGFTETGADNGTTITMKKELGHDGGEDQAHQCACCKGEN